MTRNFRSAPALIDWSNRGFASIFPLRDDLRESAVRFLPATAGRAVADVPHPAVSVHRLASESPELEARLLADAVVAARRRRPEASVAVLVQAATHAPAIIEALRAAGLPVRGVDLEPLARQPAVRDVVELGCALLHPGDRVAWLATLHAPWCGLTLADLLRLTESGAEDAIVPELLREEGNLSALSDDGRQRLGAARRCCCAPWMPRAVRPSFPRCVRCGKRWVGARRCAAMPNGSSCRRISMRCRIAWTTWRWSRAKCFAIWPNR